MKFSTEERIVQWMKIALFVSAGISALVMFRMIYGVLVDIRNSLDMISML